MLTLLYALLVTLVFTDIIKIFVFKYSNINEEDSNYIM